jgi:hypothetical protein
MYPGAVGHGFPGAIGLVAKEGGSRGYYAGAIFFRITYSCAVIETSCVCELPSVNVTVTTTV